MQLSSLPSALESGSNGGLAIPNLRCRNAVPQDSRAARQLATELPLCFEALFGLGGWCNNNLSVAQMVGGTQLGYPRAWLRRKEPSCDLGRLHEAIAQWNRRPANFNFDRRSASYKRWPRRCDGFGAYSIASACKRAQQLDRRTPSCKSSAAQADANAVARAPQTVRDSTKAVVPLVLDELQAWPARRVMLICAARSGAEAVRVAIRPSTVHAELQTLCSNPHWLIPPHS